MIHEVRQALGRNFRKKACNEPRLKFETSAVCSRSNKTFENPFKALCINPSRWFSCQALHCLLNRMINKISYPKMCLRNVAASVVVRCRGAAKR